MSCSAKEGGAPALLYFFRFEALAEDADKSQTVRERLLRYLFEREWSNSAVAKVAVELNSALLVAGNTHDRRMTFFLG